MKPFMRLFSVVCFTLALSLVHANWSSAITSDSPGASTSTSADQQPSTAEFARRAYTNATLRIYETHLRSNGVTLSESSKNKLFSGNDENELEVQGEVFDAMTARVGNGAQALLMILTVKTGKELTDGLSTFISTGTRPRNVHTNTLIDSVVARAGGSDPKPILTALNQRPRASVHAFLADLNRFLRDGTQSQSTTAREIMDAISVNAAQTGITLQQLADFVNRDLA